VTGRTSTSSAGRRRRADGAATRDRILECAGGLFAATGYAETTGKAIAVAARVDLASINYHFGSRTGLYQAVLVEAHRRLITLDVLERLERADAPAREKFERLIETLVDGALTRRGWHSRVLARELLAPSSNLEALFRQEALPKIRVIAQLVSEMTQIPIDDPAIPRCLLNVAAPCLMLFVAPRGVPGPLQEVVRMPRATLVAHLQRFALAGLEAIARDYSQAARKRPQRRKANR
jgi:TetR/AcrR family transcriptional regulator, regulator of cefoperazone and chloramphenicol sensitivity